MGVKHLASIDTELLHPSDQGGSFQTQTRRGPMRTAHPPFGFSQDSHNRLVLIAVAGLCRQDAGSIVRQLLCRNGLQILGH